MPKHKHTNAHTHIQCTLTGPVWGKVVLTQTALWRTHTHTHTHTRTGPVWGKVVLTHTALWSLSVGVGSLGFPPHRARGLIDFHIGGRNLKVTFDFQGDTDGPVCGVT